MLANFGLKIRPFWHVNDVTEGVKTTRRNRLKFKFKKFKSLGFTYTRNQNSRILNLISSHSHTNWP